jgi:hypothetical protein
VAERSHERMTSNNSATTREKAILLFISHQIVNIEDAQL